MTLPEIRLLQAAITLAEELNFSRAAERLGLTQPALSKQIYELEGQVGLRLFLRDHHGADLTEAGRAFVKEAREAVLHVERAVITARAALNGADELLNVGKSPYGNPYFVSALLSVHLPLFPGLNVKLWSNYSNELAHQVLAGTLDLALVTGVPETPKLSFLNVADDPFYIALSSEDDLTVGREIRLDEMHNRIWILLGKHANPHLYDLIHRVASEQGVRISDTLHVMTPEEVPQLIRERGGLAFLPRHGAWRIARDGITMRPLREDRLRLVTSLAVHADTKSRVVKEYLKAVARKLTKPQVSVQRHLPLTG
jgi:DNA-binding transcriptional LysR family regulator